VEAVDLLPYHKLGRAKYQAAGKTKQWWEADLLTDDEVASAAAIVRSYNLVVNVVGNTHK
jgi:pyruvate-formate lyase-activating enzyme